MSPINRKKLFPVAIFLISLFFIVVTGQLLMLIKQSIDVYNGLKISSNVSMEPLHNISRTTSPLVQIDSELGDIPIPGASGYFLVPRGEPVPFHNNNEGFRSELGLNRAVHTSTKPRLLFLGDSFTYGQLVEAGNTFPEKSAEYTHGESINAGVPGYSLAQMLLYAQRLAPKYKPDFIIAQYSPWLVSRSKTGLVTDSRFTMAPYFIRKHGQMEVMTPPFTPPLAIVKRSEKYKRTPKSLTDAMLFFTTVGIPYYLHHAYNSAIFHTRQLVGLTPPKTTDSIEIIRHSYQELDKLAKKNGSKLIILALGTLTSLHVPTNLFPKDAIVINAWEAQVEALTDRTSWGYVQKYFLWRGNPPIPVDWHPNEISHDIIARKISYILKSEIKNSHQIVGEKIKSIAERKKAPFFQECLYSNKLLKILPSQLEINHIINETTLAEFRRNGETKKCKD